MSPNPPHPPFSGYRVRRGQNARDVSPEAPGCLMRCPWSDNIHQSLNAIDRGMVMAPSSVLIPKDLSPEQRGGPGPFRGFPLKTRRIRA